MTVGTARSPDVPIPLLDHVVVLLDEAAYREVFSCEFLREQFARVKPKNVSSSIAGQYSALGVAGENTLLELFGAALPGPRRLTGGLVFSFEQPGSVQRARELLAEPAGIDAQYELVYRGVPDDDERRPWYHMLRADLGADSPLLLFLNEVTPEYFAFVDARRGPGGELLRGGYLDAAFGPAPRDGRWLRDIVAVTLRVRPYRAARVMAALSALGYRVDNDLTSAGGMLHRITGPGVEIGLAVAQTAPEGVVEIVARLGRAPEQCQELTFGGTSRLVLEPSGVARWTFTPPAG